MRVSSLPAWLWPARPAPPARAAPVATTWEGASAYGAAALSRQLWPVQDLAVGERNDGLNRVAFSLGRLVGGGELGEALVHQALLCAALGIGLGQGEAEATIRSGLQAGKSLPRRAGERGESRRACGRRGDDGRSNPNSRREHLVGREGGRHGHATG